MAYKDLTPRELATLYILKEQRIDNHKDWINEIQHEQWLIFNAALDMVSASDFSNLCIEAKKLFGE